MGRTRSFSFPRLIHTTTSPSSKSPRSDDHFGAAMSPYQQHWPAHSRDSSSATSASSSSSPITPTFSTRGHSRYPSSTSSLGTNPDSPSTAPTSKTTLHDLVEDPAERDDDDGDDVDVHLDDSEASSHEPLCICDSPFCEHRAKSPWQPSAAAFATPPEWSPGDDYFSDGLLSGEPSTKRRRSGELVSERLTSRFSRHLPTIKKRLPGHKATASVSSTNLHSGPPSRSSSLRLPTTRSVTLPAMPVTHTELTPPFSPIESAAEERSLSPPRMRAPSQAPSQRIEMEMPVVQEEPINREELASTPLLPPMLAEYFNDSSEAVASPLQSPTIAMSAAMSMVNTPIGTPVLPGFPTPPLSARPSLASLKHGPSGHAVNPLAEIPPLAIAEESDSWAIKLGHANFHVFPEPYLPEVCDGQACQRLQDDWEAAQVEFMRQASRISEHYGVTSETYKLTQEKWNGINEQWRSFHKQAIAAARATGDSTAFQPLPETLPVPQMPLLNDPQQPSKFPAVDEKDIVGPMVRYAKIQHERRPSRKPAFLKIFTDPSSLLSGRTSLNR